MTPTRAGLIARINRADDWRNGTPAPMSVADAQRVMDCPRVCGQQMVDQAVETMLGVMRAGEAPYVHVYDEPMPDAAKEARRAAGLAILHAPIDAPQSHATDFGDDDAARLPGVVPLVILAALVVVITFAVAKVALSAVLAAGVDAEAARVIAAQMAGGW